MPSVSTMTEMWLFSIAQIVLGTLRHSTYEIDTFHDKMVQSSRTLSSPSIALPAQRYMNLAAEFSIYRMAWPSTVRVIFGWPTSHFIRWWSSVQTIAHIHRWCSVMLLSQAIRTKLSANQRQLLYSMMGISLLLMAIAIRVSSSIRKMGRWFCNGERIRSRDRRTQLHHRTFLPFHMHWHWLKVLTYCAWPTVRMVACNVSTRMTALLCHSITAQ